MPEYRNIRARENSYSDRSYTVTVTSQNKLNVKIYYLLSKKLWPVFFF